MRATIDSESAKTTAGIVAEDVCVDLGGRSILRNVSLEMRRGQWVGLVGPNGSGKTTLLRTLAGLLPFRGSIRIDDEPLPEVRRRDLAVKLAYIRQSSELAFDFSVLDLTLLGRTPHRSWLAPFDAEDRTAAMEALDSVDLGGFEDRSVLELSGGELRRVLLAQGLAQHSSYVLLDEPTAHLDVHHQFGFLDTVHDRVCRGTAVLSAFHDLELAARYVDTVIVLDEGRVAATGPPSAVLSREVIENVFRMTADISRTADGSLAIRYIHRAAASRNA